MGNLLIRIAFLVAFIGVDYNWWLWNYIGSLGLPIVLIALIASSLALSKLLESQETLGDKVDSPVSFDSISLQQMVAIPTRISSSY